MTNNESENFFVPETERAERAKVDVIAPEGLGYGEGDISVASQVDKGELDYESLRIAAEIITDDPEVFVHVDEEANDDGCGDGRGTKLIYKFIDPITKEVQTFKRSLRRAKLFGGGLIASSSMWRAVDGVPVDGKTLKGDRDFMKAELKKRGKSYGAHTDDHAEGENCGCGAIDKYEKISRNVVEYKTSILKSLKELYGDGFDDNLPAISRVIGMYEQLGGEYFAGVTGRSTMDDIEEDGAVVKQLAGAHQEGIVVINTVKGMTFDQDKFREKLIDRGLSPNIQAFVIDEWRGREYADIVADIAESRGMNRDEAYAVAYADFLIRTLAVSATLTKGDQPVLLRQAEQEFAPVVA